MLGNGLCMNCSWLRCDGNFSQIINHVMIDQLTDDDGIPSSLNLHMLVPTTSTGFPETEDPFRLT